MNSKLIKHKWYYINPEVFRIKWNTTKGGNVKICLKFNPYNDTSFGFFNPHPTTK